MISYDFPEWSKFPLVALQCQNGDPWLDSAGGVQHRKTPNSNQRAVVIQERGIQIFS